MNNNLKIGDLISDDVLRAWTEADNNIHRTTYKGWTKDKSYFNGSRTINVFKTVSGHKAIIVSSTEDIYLKLKGLKQFIINFYKRPCPHCGSNWDNGSILETLVKQRIKETNQPLNWLTLIEVENKMKEMYQPPYRWGREIGVELEGTDRVGYYKCPDCNTCFDRNTMKEIKI